MKKITLLLVAFLLLFSCGPQRVEPKAASQAGDDKGDRKAFEVTWDNWGDPEEEVWIKASVVNHTDEARTPSCYLIDRAVGAITLDDTTPIEPGEKRSMTGTASFPIPSFNYECDGFCWGVRCFIAGLEPNFIQRCMELYGGIPSAGAEVTVPDVNGRALNEVGFPLYKAGLKPVVSDELVRSWRDRTGPLGKFNPRNVLRWVLLRVLLVQGPRVRVSPPPGSKIEAGQSVVLHHFKS